MNKLSLKQACLTTIRLSIWASRLLACLCLIAITGCFFKADPDHENLEFYENTLPNITITRRVVPEVGYEKREIYGSTDFTNKVESESRFGDPDEEPDLSCIYTGLREALPSIHIIPTSNFWEQIDASQDAVELTELFATPQSDRLRALQADVLVIAYHARIDLEYTMMEGVFEGVYDDRDRETATIVVVDLDRKTIVHGSSISYEDWDAFAHVFFIVPMIMSSREPFDICNTVARQAGTAIAETMPDRPIRALVVVAGEDPTSALKLTRNVVSESDLEWSKAQILQKAEQGDSYAQYRLYTILIESEPSIAYRWLCRSADNGHLQARYTLGQVFEHSRQNHVQAYVWYSLSDKFNEYGLQYFVDKNLTTEEYQKARVELLEWRPGQCKRDLGLVP